METKIKNAFLLLSLIFCFLLLNSCVFSKSEPINISVKVINSETKKPKIGDTVVVRKVEKPWYKMWQYIEVANSITDSLGTVYFTIDKTKGHTFVSYGPNSEYGSTEYDERELNENDEIIIKVKPKARKRW